MNIFFLISPWVLQTLIWVPTRFCLWFFCHLKVSGLENIKKLPRGVIFVANHTTELDPIVIPASLSFFHHLMPMFYTSREKGFYIRSGWRKIFYGGFFFKMWGAHPVIVGLQNYALSLQTHIEIVKYGGSVIIFPEGKTTRDGKLLKPKGGMAYLAHETHAPVIPVALSGLFGLSLKKFFLRKIHLNVAFGKPLAVSDLSPDGQPMMVTSERDTYIEAAEKVMAIIAKMLPQESVKTEQVVLPHKSVVN